MGYDRQSRKTFRLVRRSIAAVSLAIALASTLPMTAEDNSRAVQPTPPCANPRDEDVAANDLVRLVEEDWILQARSQPIASAADARARGQLHQSDAAGACDGLKDGKYGFHTGLEANPWWQVDLRKPTAIARIVVYNRLDYLPGLHNADHLQILTSDDAKNWTLRYDNQGRHFGGVRGAKPLDVKLDPSKARARFVRLRVPSERPIYFHLDEVEAYGPHPSEKNLALGQPANQSSVSQWSTPKAPISLDYPTAQVIERGRRLAADLQRAGVDVRPHLQQLAEAAQRLAALPADAAEQARRRLYLEVRWTVRRLAFSNPLLAFDKLLFVKRFTQETYPDVCLNHMPWVSRPGGDLCVLSAAPGSAGLFAALGDCRDSRADPSMAAGRPVAKLRYLLNRALGPGHVHGMDLWYGGDRVVFGYAKARSDQPPPGWLNRATSFDLRRSEEPTHIFEIGIDGTGLRQLTQGEWSDLDPCYLPSGDIVFVSERCGYSLQCNELDKDEISCNLYVMRPDGSGIRRLTVTKDGDYLPHVLADGTIGYTRWEYHERGWAHIQSLWYVRPDGTGADALFKQHFNEPWAVEECRSVPGSHKLVGIATGHHTLPAGPVILIEPQAGMNDPNGIHIVTPGVRPPEGGMSGNPVPGGGVRGVGGLYMTPWPLSEAHFLASYTYGKETDATGYALYLIGVDGTKELVYRDPAISCSIPIPLRPRQKPPILPDNTDPAKPYAVCAVNDVALGVDGVDPTAIRYIRIAEPLGWPYCNTYGGQRYEPDVKGVMINWNPVRILGTVPVESDGSAFFQVPVDTAVYFQLLDENHMELRRMRSFISFQSGEQRSCTGCHHTWEKAPPATPTPLAMRRDPVVPTPPPWGADKPISFLRDVQPVFDRHCVACHVGLKPAGGLDFSGGLTPRHNRAYDTILAAKLISRSNVGDDAKVTPPLAFGSHKSHLIAVLRKAPHTERVKLPQDDWLRLVTWIDANGPYHDGFINKRQPEPPYDLAADRTLADQIAAVHAKRCGACHAPAQVSRLDWVALRQPAASLFLTAPLAREAGGAAKCKDAVYRDTSDPDYKAVRELVEAAARRAWALPRRDLRALQAQEAHAARPAP